MSKQVEWAQRIAAIANTGLYYVKDDFDRERYLQLLSIAADMLARDPESDPAALLPLVDPR